MQAVGTLQATNAEVAADQALGIATKRAGIAGYAALTRHARFVFAIAANAGNELPEAAFESARAKLRFFGHGAVAALQVRSTRRSSAARARVSASSAPSS